MNNWLTTHWPHPIPDDHPWHIYLQRDHRDAATGITDGDRVFFYEFLRHKPLRNPTKLYAKGQQGVVRMGYVNGKRFRRDTTFEYSDGSRGYWSWTIPVERHEAGGFVARRRLCQILNYKLGYNFHGFQSGTGIKKLDDDEAAELMRAFRAGRFPRTGTSR